MKLNQPPSTASSSRRQVLTLLLLLVGAAIAYGVWLAIRAHRDLVTLDVRNMDVRKVIRKIEWQTWESISVHKDVQGLVTLQVRRVPLEEVLRIIGEQTSSRWSAFYPLYSRSRSLARLKQALRGEVDPTEHGWTNLQTRGFFRGGPGGFGGGRGGGFDPDTNAPVGVSLQLQEKDVPFATLAFDRFARVRVVPEDGTTATINLTLDHATVSQAVATLAKKARRSWTKLYSLRSEFGFRGPGGPGGPEFAGGPPSQGGEDAADGERRGWRRPEMTDEQREAMRQQRETLEQQLTQALPAEERQRMEAAQQQREQQFRDMQNLTPEQRRERFMQMGGRQMDRRGLERLKNTTPEQRAQQQQRMSEMRKRFQEMQTQQGGQPQQPQQRRRGSP